jgi:integrase/recombinase XerD
MVQIPSRELARAGLENLPAAIGRAGEAAAWRFIEFFAATIRNRNTRAAYAHAVSEFFAWCEEHRVFTLEQVKPVVIAAYIENHPMAAPTVKQHLAAIPMLFDFLVTVQIVPMNPASSVRARSAAQQDAGLESRPGTDASRFDQDGFNRWAP